MKYAMKKRILYGFIGIAFLLSMSLIEARWGWRGGWHGGWNWRRPWSGWGFGIGWGRPWIGSYAWWPRYYAAPVGPVYVRSKSDVWIIKNNTNEVIHIKPRGVAPVTLRPGERSKVARGVDNDLYIMPESKIHIGKGIKGHIASTFIEINKDSNDTIVLHIPRFK